METTYNFVVKAKDDKGAFSVNSAPLVYNHVNDAPTAPTNFRGRSVAGVTGRDVTLSWTASSDTDGTIARYEISMNGGAWSNVGLSLSQRFSGLTAGVAYRFRIRAIDNLTLASPITNLTFTP